MSEQKKTTADRKSGDDNKMKSTKNHKKEDSTFHSKHIHHDPQAESARAVYGLADRQDAGDK